MQNEYDAVIVGAGHNSLACGLHLAARGWSVALFERGAEPGGAVRSGEYTHPGFVHDWAAMNLSLFAGSPFFRQHGAEITRHGLEFVPVQHCFASVFPDGKWLGVSTDLEATASRIAALSERDSATWRWLVAEFPAEAEHLFGLLGSPMSRRGLAAFSWRLWRARGTGGALALSRFLLSSPRKWLEETFERPEMHALLGAWGMHLDFAPDIAGGALFPYLEGMANQSFGMVLGKGGAGSMSDAMVAALRARGGLVECGAEVVTIRHEGGEARGITLADGQEIRARKAVIANVAPSALTRLTGPLEAGFDRAMANFSHAPGTMMIHLALEDLPDWRASPELRDFAYVHVAPSLDQMARTYSEAKAGLLPSEPVVVVGQPTVIDRSRAPEGRHVLWVQVRMAPAVIRGDAAGKIAARDWADAAEPFAERVLDLLEGHAPGLRARIIGRRIVTPDALEADNPNLVGGDQVCGSHHLAQHFLFRPARGHADGSTPLRRLHLTGAAVWPGGGTGAGPGVLLARRLAGA
ncbi:MAG: NAD(P)/FAD-dependent oxidoreductase [Rhodobacteraceae bacterium]|nr:NAD(P)/FAD-dependent oxidoreductase [Paracoccaceae bacterium]